MKVLVTDHVFGDLDAERAALAEIGCELELAPDPAALPAAVAGAAGLMVCFAQVDEQVIEAASDCRIIARYGIGVDNVDVAAATRKGSRSPTCRTTASTRWPTTRWRCCWRRPAAWWEPRWACGRVTGRCRRRTSTASRAGGSR